MPTTVFTATFSPSAVDVTFKRQNVGGDDIDGVTEIDMIGPIVGGSSTLSFVAGGIQTEEDLSSPYPTSYDTAASDASGLLQLDPTKTYTLTITES